MLFGVERKEKGAPADLHRWAWRPSGARVDQSGELGGRNGGLQRSVAGYSGWRNAAFRADGFGECLEKAIARVTIQ
ncbi:MAG: hypothetical protein ACJAQW_002135, partial [Paracoccaceae bacterium]